MRVRALAVYSAVLSAGLSSPFAGAQTVDGAQERCFDKGTLEYVVCPTPAAPAAPTNVVVPATPPAAPPAHSWSGPYLGVGAGFGWFGEDDDQTITFTPAYTGDPSFAPGAIPNTVGHGAQGAFGGARAGFRQQFNRVVAGGQVGFGVGAANGQFNTTTNVPLAGPATTTDETSVNWLTTVRGTAGVTLVPEVLAFVSGGLAIADVDRRGAASIPALDQFWSGSSDEIRVGWTVGAGLEYALTRRLSLGAEYLYIDLGEGRYTLEPVSAGAAAIGSLGTVEDDLTGHMAQIFLSYKLGSFGGP